jgi:prefoldin subunit 5
MIIDKSIKSLQNKIKKLEALQQKEQHEIDPN